MTDPARLTPTVFKTISTGPNIISVVSYWEVTLKSMKGNLHVGDLRSWWFDTLDQLAANPLPLRPEHISAIQMREPIHADPFDRLLIAQSTTDDLTFVTTDRTMKQYASSKFKVIT